MAKGKGKAGRPAGSKNLGVNKYVSLTPPVQRKLFKALSQGHSVHGACAAAGVSRTAYYYRLKTDEKFKQAVELARDRASEYYESELDNLIRNGSTEEVYDEEGNLVKKTVKKDGRLLMKKLEAHDPETYGKKTQTTHKHEGGEGDNTALLKLAEMLKISIEEKEVGKKHQDSIEADYTEKD